VPTDPLVAVILLTIEPKTKADHDKLVQGLQKLMAEDLALRVDTDKRTGRTIIRGMSELHLEVIVERLKREFDVAADVGKPQVAYRETIRGKAECDKKYAKQTGGHGQYAHVKIRIEPLPPGSGFEFENDISGGKIPKEYIKPTEAGMIEALEGGVLAGYPMSDLKVTLYDGSYHEVDSSEMAFKIAASMAFQDAAKKAEPVLLEPIMRVELVAPEEFMGEVIGGIHSRRGQIEGVEPRGTTRIIRASVPLSEMFGYAANAPGAIYSMRFDRYEPLLGGPDADDEDRSAPVTSPRPPPPKGKHSGVALPEPDQV